MKNIAEDSLLKGMRKDVERVIKYGKSLEKHPYLTSLGSGAAILPFTGAFIGGVAGGISEDDTVLSGAAKGALINTGINVAAAVPAAHLISKKVGANNISEAGKLLQGMGHDGLDLLIK